MGVYTRFKRNPEGFRQLVELLESTPASRRQKMIDIGMQEDPAFTERAMQFMLTFKDIIELPDMELAELMAKAPPRISAYAVSTSPAEVSQRFLKCSKPPVAAEMKDFLTIKIGPREVGGAQLKMVEVARELEKKGLIRTKRIPT